MSFTSNLQELLQLLTVRESWLGLNMKETGKCLELLLGASMSHQEMSKLIAFATRVQLRLIGKEL